MGDIVLERNLCFVDTPTTSLTRTEQTEVIIYYMRQQLGRAIGALDSSNVDFQNMLAGNGGSKVDAIIFLISQGECLITSHTHAYAPAHIHFRYP